MFLPSTAQDTAFCRAGMMMSNEGNNSLRADDTTDGSLAPGRPLSPELASPQKWSRFGGSKSLRALPDVAEMQFSTLRCGNNKLVQPLSPASASGIVTRCETFTFACDGAHRR